LSAPCEQPPPRSELRFNADRNGERPTSLSAPVPLLHPTSTCCRLRTL
jgi:hypothetical protein